MSMNTANRSARLSCMIMIALGGLIGLNAYGPTPVMASSFAEAWIDLGPADNLAIDQPRVTFYLKHSQDGTIDGPDPIFNQALLDTGANGVVLAFRAYMDFDLFDVNPARYKVETRLDGSRVQYEELGVAGTELFDVLEPYDVHYAGFGPAGVEHVVHHVRPLGNPDIDFGGFSAILGMPAMMNKRTTINLQSLLDPDPDYLFGLPYIEAKIEDLASFSPPDEPANHAYHVDLRMWMPPHSEPQVEGDPTPTFIPLPFVDGVQISRNNTKAAGSFLLDTGAQITLISHQIAEAVGIDLQTDVIDYMEVGGVGGSVFAPLVSLDGLHIPAERKADQTHLDMQMSDLIVAVLDIGEGLIDEPLDGILGMNILTSGYADAVLGGLFGQDMNTITSDPTILTEDRSPGYFEHVVLEFLEESEGHATGQMSLHVNPDYNHITFAPSLLAGDMNADGQIDFDDINPFMLALNDPDAYEAQYGLAPLLVGDINGDGQFDFDDISPFVDLFLNGSAVIPEPGTLALLGVGGLAVLVRRRRI